MKQIAILSSLIFLFIIMLFFPKATLAGAADGLLLWFQMILPTLLPFMILSNLLLQTNAIYYISCALKPILQPLFQISTPSCYAVLVGFLCGYPMGAKIIADLTRSNRISKEEGQYLLSFCNNSSPMFILSYISLQILQAPSFSAITLLILFISPIFMFFF